MVELRALAAAVLLTYVRGVGLGGTKAGCRVPGGRCGSGGWGHAGDIPFMLSGSGTTLRNRLYLAIFAFRRGLSPFTGMLC